MQPATSLLFRLELTWWAITVLILLGVLLPFQAYWQTYPFFWSNVVFLLVFITLTRYIFFLPYTFLAHRQFLKVAFVFICIPSVFLLIQELNRFQTFLDYNGIEAILGISGLTIENSLINYTYSEMLLFGVGSIICGIVFPLRLLWSVWRLRNRGRV